MVERYLPSRYVGPKYRDFITRREGMPVPGWAFDRWTLDKPTVLTGRV
ncbi:MAG: hypothetical protein K6U14_09120 [Firmicutes bacterium]|nr:hypothetical protein [Alicyclobacillaceae bacterium]MCL6497772.1 hypothetical protein [Bacillota bacterium]